MERAPIDSYRERPSVAAIAATVGDLQEWREQLVRNVFLALVVAGLFVAGAGSYYAYTSERLWLIPVYVAIYVLVVATALWRRAPYAFRAGYLVAAAYGLAVIEFSQRGRGGSGRVFLVLASFLAALLFGRRTGRAALIVTIGTMAAIGAAFSTGVLSIPLESEAISTNAVAWVSNTLVSLMVGLLIVVSLNYLVPRLVTALSQSRALLQVTEAQRASLEEQVDERTRGLRAVADVARATTAVLDPDLLLPQVVDLVRQRFGLYYVALFLLDDAEAYAVLRAGTGQAGAQMLANGHRLEVGGASMVGRCALTCVPDVQLDVGRASVRFDNPLLPRTRSELALPLRARERVIGVLSVQSEQEAAFDETYVALLQTMADQVAVAIDNARLFAENQAALRDMRSVQRRYTADAWDRFLRRAESKAYATDEADSSLREAIRSAEVRESVQRGQVAVLPNPNARHEREPDREGSAVVAPISVRGELIGVLGLQREGEGRPWGEDDVSLVETIVERMGTVAENLRLLDEAQRREADERAIREIAERMRRAPDLDALTRLTVREVASVVGVSEAFLQLSALPEEGDERNR